MDWIEQIFHIDPDGGNGSIELAIFVIMAFIAVAVVTGIVRRHR